MQNDEKKKDTSIANDTMEVKNIMKKSATSPKDGAAGKIEDNTVLRNLITSGVDRTTTLQNKLQQEPPEHTIDVCFHSVISPTFFSNLQKDRVVVYFHKHTGTIAKEVGLELESPRQDGYIVGSVTFKVPLPCELYYNYAVSNTDAHSTFEYYSPDGDLNEKGSERRRNLSIQQSNSPKDVCHFYDGIIRGREEMIGKYKSWWKNLKKMFGGEDEYKKFLKEDIDLALSAFLPKQLLNHFSDKDTKFEEAVKILSRMKNSLKEQYRGICTFIELSFDNLFQNVLLLQMKKTIHQFQRVNRENLHADAADITNIYLLRLAKAAISAHIVVLFDIKLDRTETDVLCEALLPLPNYTDRACPDVVQMKKVMPSILSEVTSSIHKLAERIAGTTDNPSWLFCVPVIHFMRLDIKPFQHVPSELNYNDADPNQKDRWWGTVKFRNAIKNFKEFPEWDRPACEILKILSPYFEVDYLLPRTVTASMNLQILHEITRANIIPVDVVLASTYFYCSTLQNSKELDMLKDVLQHVASQMVTCDKDIPTPRFDSIYRIFKIASDLIGNVIKLKDGNIVFFVIEIYLIGLDEFQKINNQKYQREDHKYKETDHWTEYKYNRDTIFHWLENELFENQELMLWNKAFQIRLKEGKVKKLFRETLEFRFHQTIQEKEKILPEKLVEIYCSHADTFEETVQEILSKAVLKAIKYSSSFDWRKTKDGMSNMRLSQLLSKVFEKEWDLKNLDDPVRGLKHALMWEPFHTYMELFCENREALNPNCQRIMERFRDITKNLTEELLQGNICVGDLRMLISREKQFQKVVAAIKDLKSDDISIALNGRHLELQAFENLYQTVQEFTKLCTKCKADAEPLESQLESISTTGIDTLYLDALVDTSILQEQIDPESYQPIVIAFKLFSSENLSLLPYIVKRCKIPLFAKIWKKKGKENSEQLSRKLTIDEVFENVWYRAGQDWFNLCKKLISGDLTFTEFNKWFKTRDPGELRRELLLIDNGVKAKWIDERIYQVKNFDILRNCIYGAKVIIEVVNEFELKQENFIQIFDISRVENVEDTSMKLLDRDLLKTCSILREITKEQADCLKELNKCASLVKWLQNTMKGGLKELQVFVDLASISAGEGDLEIAKVNCLHSATTGYAPLIFSLGNDCDAKEFLEKCQDVWKDLDINPQLPKKLSDTARQLKWLKSIKKCHGAIEVTTLSQAEAINKKGVYRVGNLKNTPLLENPVLSDVIELHVPHKEGRSSSKDRYYRYEQLHDLQSRLMLVTGKAENGKEEVERFMLILDSVVRLGSIYQKLVSNGCVLFSHWCIKIICNPSSSVCAFILFRSDQESQSIRTRMDEENKDISLVLQHLARFLEQCHKKWLDYIDQTRDKYFCLTYFTIDQIVILQKELVKAESDGGPSPLIFHLLSAVKRDCTKQDLAIAISSIQTTEKTGSKGKSSKANINSTMKKTSKHIKEVKETYLQKIDESSFASELGKEACRNVNPNDIDRACCMTNEDQLMESLRTNLTQSQADPTSVSIKESLISRLDIQSREESVKEVLETLEELWKIFLSSFTNGVSDYLSVEHLGMILNKLAEKDSDNIQRTFLPCFISGDPNLLICAQSEIYKTVISIYSNDEDSPLPQADEVLLCTPYTTLDMVQTFWKRVFYSEGGKIFCLVNADLLDYDVSDRAEHSLERHMAVADSNDANYRLVVICSSENEYKSRMVAALDKYHRPAIYTNVDSIRKYLLNKFQVETECIETPACVVDFDRCNVRVVKSLRAGIGKTLFKNRMIEKLSQLVGGEVKSISIPVYEKILNSDEIMDIFKKEILSGQRQTKRIFHIDISHEVKEGVDNFLFQLLILGCHRHSLGYLWRRSEMDYYIIESMPLLDMKHSGQRQGKQLNYIHTCLDILPFVTCRSPRECLDIISNPENRPIDFTDHDILFDQQIFESEKIQRPYMYLKNFTIDKTDEQLYNSMHQTRLEANMQEENRTQINAVDNKQCLEILLSHCGIKDPSWSELSHFVSFLSRQLEDFESSAFCSVAAQPDLPGFSNFVLTCLIQMSRDFATRSLVVSEETPMQMLHRHEQKDNHVDIIQQYQMRRTWETSPHPYLFFNPDHHSMTFLGFNIERRSGNLIDHQTRTVLEQEIITPNLFDALERNNVDLAENFDSLQREQKIEKLCQVMGLELVHDPDETYELTTDNSKKILAIYMRFRCDIPVIIMGETGCGKTRLVKFMCSLQQPPGVNVENMILMKVHGGTKPSDIVRKVRDAENIASRNTEKYPNMFTVLFFDEANTTEAIGVLKEMMCDKSLDGKPMKLNQSLKIVAACNPYRKHSDELIKRLEQAGLGYHVDVSKTADTIGSVPMRRLVYRVQPLPQSMLPLVWDFGQLKADVEKMYIRQMVLRYIRNKELPSLPNLDEVLSDILTASQDFMRKQKDECSFVSLRDVERTLQVMSWFKQQSQTQNLLFRKMTQQRGNDDPESDSDDEIPENEQQQQVDDVTRALILAIGVSYHACLKNREEYRKAVASYFKSPLTLKRGAVEIEEEISKCQSAFLDSVKLAPNIARNQALKENVFMMIVCIEMRIPMFLVGKPGSSKSLAKTIVADAMQGNAAQDELFKKYKQVQMISYQCSPLSVPEGIIGAFRQCAAFQMGKNLNRFVSVVVLDEVGLAEDSPRMPLKTLHPLLEDGCIDDEQPETHKKVAFIGISNWALDPAKMNRGILVQRDVPDITELIESAEGICCTNIDVLDCIKPFIQPLAESYLDLFQVASGEMREFFGLRDFYSLIKMLYAFVSRSEKKPTWLQLQHCILRNFGGLENIKPVDIFCKKLIVDRYELQREDDPDNSPPGLIQACLRGDNISNSETRYLLLLTENYGALTMLQQKIFTMENVVVLFGSSFPSDQEYTQVCRNINRVKICMETGSTVILLNLENLYESLYDALNQYYVEFGGERYVDLGLGTHRVKCRVHQQFRLIVVAEKQIVYDKFPIPLINRLEKHFLSLKTMLTPSHLQLTVKLQEWAQQFCKDKVPRHLKQRKETKKIGDAFIGYHADACAAIILHACQKKNCSEENIAELEKEVLDFSKDVLLWCASPVAVLLREDKTIFVKYFIDQHHDNIFDYLHFKIEDQKEANLTVQITTHSKLLSHADVDMLCKSISSLQREHVLLMTLQSFDTEQQFSRQIRSFFRQGHTSDQLLMVQCDSGDANEDLLACARYTIQGELQQIPDKIANMHVVLLIQVPGIACGRFTGFQCGLWRSIHIDDIHPEDEDIPSVAEMYVHSVGDLLYPVMVKTLETSDHKEEEIDTPKDKEQHSSERVFIDIDRLDPSHFETVADNVEQGSLKGLLWCCRRSEVRTKMPPRRFNDRIVTLDTSDVLLKEKKQHSVDPSSIKGPIKKVVKKKISNGKSKDSAHTNIATDKIQKLKKHFKMDNLIKTCIHAALHYVKDPQSNPSKAIYRLNVLMNWLHNKEDALTILSGINKHLSVLLQEREHVTGRSGKNWLTNEAIKPQNINIPGTFRRFAVQCLEAKIIPVLAFIIAFIDTNNNLDLLSHEETWKTDIWLQIINDPVLTELKYSAMVTPNKQQEIKEVHVEYTAVDGKTFSACMPFSWLIFRLVDDILRKTVDNRQTEECYCDLVMKSASIFQKLPLGKVLNSISDTNRQEILKAIIKDFVYMVHPVKSDTECQLICEEIVNGCRDLIQEAFGRLIPSMFGCHMIFILHDVRFTNFSHIVRVWPKCSQKILTYQQNYSNFYLITNEEITLDIIALHLLIAQLDPGEGTFNDMSNGMLWLQKVCEYRPVIEMIFGHFHQDFERKEKNYGPNCRRAIKDNIFYWNRAFIVKMFFQHVCTNTNFRDTKTLWNALSDRACLTKVKSLEKVENFLKDSNQAILQCFGKENEEYKDFRRRCNSFFMEVVSKLCFGTGTPPSTEILDKLLTYITGIRKSETSTEIVLKELAVFDDCVDQAPVVRSFILQQIMLTCSDQEVQKHLTAYFTHANDLLKTSRQPDKFIELCLLVLQCFEDSLHQRYSSDDDKIYKATRMLEDAFPYINSNINVLEKIKYIANVRFALILVATLIYEIYSKKLNIQTLDPRKKLLLEAASNICAGSKMERLRKFLVKQLCRCHGIDIYHNLVSSEDMFFHWVGLPELQEDWSQVKESNDRYIVFGEYYKELRDTVVETMISEKSDKLEQILRKGNCGWQTRIQLLLALHREICMKNVKGQPVFSEKGSSFLRNYLKSHEIIKNKSFVDKLFDNSIWTKTGNITNGMSLAQQNIFCLLTHYLILMSEIPEKTSLFTPLHRMAVNPESMIDSFFPTMPQDDLQEMKTMILNFQKASEPENTFVFYRCPNGHPYIIGECGKPWEVYQCYECCAQIGGTQHKLQTDNTYDEGEDITKTGHILGLPTNLSPVNSPCRKLTITSTAVLRLLTHMSMYIGTNYHFEAICQSIKPEIVTGDVYEYLLEHINFDLTSVQNILGINTDDAVLFIHHLLVNLMNIHNAENLTPDVCGLLSKESRSLWEDEFDKRYIEPALQNVKSSISACNQGILSDEKLSKDILMEILYETNKPQQNQDIQHLHEVPSMWRYRELISLNHLKQNLEGTARTMPVPVLRLFLKEDHHLRAIRFIPSIMRLQRMLIQKYNRKLDRTEIAALTIGDVKQEFKKDRQDEEFEQLLRDFKMAWTYVKDLLRNFVCLIKRNPVAIDEAYLRSDIADDATQISYLIPTYRDTGMCSYILLFFLIQQHNLFLQNFCLHSDIPTKNLPKVHVKDISSAHLISYHPDKDIIPMLYANCNYTFEVGQGTRIEYNFTNLERQLMDRFLFSKSFVTSLNEIETITYRSESTNAVVFVELCEKMKQERLNPAVRSQICGELHMRNLPELCDSLDNLDLCISFLKSIGSNPNMSLSYFMENTLKIDKPLISTKARTASKCKHAMSLWISFALERAKQLAKYDRRAFEGVSDSFKKELTEGQIHVMNAILGRLPAEQINTLLELIFECIVFKIDVPHNINDEDYIDISQISFRDQLIGYIDTSPFEEDLHVDDSLMVVIGQMPSDMDDQLRILTAQSVDVWNEVNKCRQRKIR